MEICTRKEEIHTPAAPMIGPRKERGFYIVAPARVNAEGQRLLKAQNGASDDAALLIHGNLHLHRPLRGSKRNCQLVLTGNAAQLGFHIILRQRDLAHHAAARRIPGNGSRGNQYDA